MKRESVLLTAIAVLCAAAFTSRANVVYVSESAADVTNAQLHGGGFNGQDGSIGNPFGSIQAAYSFLWTQTGTHTINLINDGDGVWSGSEIGVNEFDNGNGYIRMAPAGSNPWPTSDPSWTSVTLNGGGGATLRMSDAGDGANTYDMNTYKVDQHPAAYEKEVVNPGGTTTANRGNVIRGLWNASGSQSLPGMIVENLDIILGGGHVLVGSTSAGAGTFNEFTFNNVNLTLQYDDVDNDLGTSDGDPWGRSAFFVIHADQASLDGSSLDFNNSTINLRRDSNADWGAGTVFYVGTGWGTGVGQNYEFPAGMIDGNNTSKLYYWNGAEYVEWSDLNSDIWQSGRNANTLTAYENGVGGANEFLVNFNTIPEPATGMMVALATVALVFSGRRRRV